MIIELLKYAETSTSNNVFHLKAPLLVMKKRIQQGRQFSRGQQWTRRTEEQLYTW